MIVIGWPPPNRMMSRRLLVSVLLCLQLLWLLVLRGEIQRRAGAELGRKGGEHHLVGADAEVLKPLPPRPLEGEAQGR